MLLLSVAERREAEEEQRQEAANLALSARPPSPRLIETPAEEAAMNTLAAERAIERERWVAEAESRPPRVKRPRPPEADSESRFDPK
jgi:hypothetical protein